MSKQPFEQIKPEQLKDLNFLEAQHGGYNYHAEIRQTMQDNWALDIYLVDDSKKCWNEFSRVYRTAKAALKKLKEYWKGDAVEWRLL